jgi:hypothetical protein
LIAHKAPFDPMDQSTCAAHAFCPNDSSQRSHQWSCYFFDLPSLGIKFMLRSPRQKMNSKMLKNKSPLLQTLLLFIDIVFVLLIVVGYYVFQFIWH